MTFLANPGGSQTVSTASGGKFYAFNTIAEASVLAVAPANPQRQKIRFINPGINDLYIAPAIVQVGGSDSTLTPSNAALGGCIPLYGNGGVLEISGECQFGWQAFAKTGAGSANALTVIDSNIP